MTANRTSLAACVARLAVLGAVVLGASTCGGSSSSSSPSSPSTPTQPAVTVQYVSVTGTFLFGAVGGTTQVRAIAYTTSGSQDVTGQATWASSNDSIATVSSSGLVSAKGTGLAVITASYQGVWGVAGISVATAVNVTGTWTGSSVNPTSDITMQLTQVGDSVSGGSSVLGDGATYIGTFGGTVNGGTVILGGSVSSSSGSLFSSWTDERCALENAHSLKCVNPSTLAGGSFTRMEITFARH